MSLSGLKALKNLTLNQTPHGYTILANKKDLKINNKQIVIPLKAKSFAESLIVEWQLLKELKPSQLPLSQLYSRSIDLKDKIAKQEAIDQVVRFFMTDSLLFLPPFPSNLKEKQDSIVKPLLNSFRKSYGLTLNTTEDLFLSPEDKDREWITNYLTNCSCIKLSALERASITAKSALIAIAACEQKVTPLEAATLARLETISQIEWFGEVEDSHDVDEEFVHREMNSVSYFINELETI